MARRLSESFNKKLLRAFPVRPVAYNPLLGKVAHSATAGLLMSQLLFWWGKGKNRNWIFKTIKEIKDETNLTRSQQEAAIKKWMGLEVLYLKKCGVPPKRHFQIDFEKLKKLAENVYLLQKSAKQLSENGILICKFPQYNTENTSEENTPIEAINNIPSNANFDEEMPF